MIIHFLIIHTGREGTLKKEGTHLLFKRNVAYCVVRLKKKTICVTLLETSRPERIKYYSTVLLKYGKL